MTSPSHSLKTSAEIALEVGQIGCADRATREPSLKSRPYGRVSAFAVRSSDLGDGPHRSFGAALEPKTDGRLVTPELITERLIRPRSMGPCKLCGERRWICDCDDSTFSREAGASKKPPASNS
jgi:hypothetical protein